MSKSGTSPSNPGWDSAPWESSLTHGSLAEPTASTDRGTPEQPSPFSRQGSNPADALGADPEVPAGTAAASASSASSDSTPPPAPTPVPPTESSSWPTYPGDEPSDPTPPSQPTNGYPAAGSYPAANGYPAASTYGQPAPAYDPQPTPPYGGYADPTPPADAAAPYGSNPYAANPYDTNPYEVNPYQPSYGGYGAYGIVPTVHPQSVPALVTGILGLAICPFVGIAGLVLGNKARKAIDAEPGRYTGRGQATAGFVLGIISIVYAVLWVILVTAGMSGALDN